MFSVIKKHFPKLLPLYVDLYKKNNKYGIPSGGTQGYINVNKVVHELSRRYGISDRIPRFIPQIENQKNIIVSTILHNLSYYLLYVSEEPWNISSKYANLGRAIESSSKMIDSLNKKDMIREFKLTLEQFSLIDEILETGYSTALNEFQDPTTVYLLNT
jgi:hypothetical protein